jgi:hypothetical protein
MKQANWFAAGMLAAGVVVAAPASAAGYCSAGTASEKIALGDVTFAGASADDCYGVGSGNINGTSGATWLNAADWGSGWSYLDATDAAGATFMGLNFDFSAATGTGGALTLNVTDTNGAAALNLPATMDIVVGLKGSTKYALWEFDNVALTAVQDGTFSIAFTNPGGKIPGLSHATLFGRASASPVPEAHTYQMLLAGLGLVAFVAQRRRRH